ncbi:unnamed protein product [Gordionus sp. m RMFG-2023]
MTGLYNLNALINYEGNFEIVVVNGSDINCTLYKNYKPRIIVMRLIFQYLGLIILISSVIGNSLGLYCAMKGKVIYIRVYLTRVLHSVNLVNCIFMFLYPVLDMVTGYHLIPFRNQKSWNVYMVHYHFPLAKTFFNFSFGIYVIFAISQMIAIVYPHYYRRYFTLRKIKIMIMMCFLYYCAWYIPSAWWFELLTLKNICGFDSGFVIYSRIFATFKSSAQGVGWIVFGVFREFFTRFLPVGTILTLNYLSIQQKKIMLKLRLKNALSNLQKSTADIINRAVVIPEFLKKSAFVFIITGVDKNLVDRGIMVKQPTNNYIMQPSKIITERKCMNSSPKSNLRVSGSSNILKINSQLDSLDQGKIKQRELEYKISLRMLTILMIEFVVFLFPVSIFIIMVDFNKNQWTTGESEMALAGCTLLEYSYTSFAFYLNMIFNPAYREQVHKIFRNSKLVRFFKH